MTGNWIKWEAAELARACQFITHCKASILHDFLLLRLKSLLYHKVIKFKLSHNVLHIQPLHNFYWHVLLQFC